jgi:hypothetical protein
MDVDVTGYMEVAQHITGIVSVGGFEFWHQSGDVAIVLDAQRRPEDQLRPICSEPHGLLEDTKVCVERITVSAHDDQLPDLIGRHQKRTIELFEKARKVRGVDASKG